RLQATDAGRPWHRLLAQGEPRLLANGQAGLRALHLSPPSPNRLAALNLMPPSLSDAPLKRRLFIFLSFTRASDYHAPARRTHTNMTRWTARRPRTRSGSPLAAPKMRIKEALKEMAEKLIGARILRTLPRGVDVFADLSKHVPQLNIKIIFDVGANLGQS